MPVLVVNDHGYTLAEMLVALTVIALALGGLGQAVHALGVMQSAAMREVAEERALRSAQVGLERVLNEDGGANASAAPVTGSANGFRVDCGAPAACGATVAKSAGHIDLTFVEPTGASSTRLPVSVDQARFVYGGAEGESDTWPAASLPRRRLEWIELRGGPSAHPVIIAEARLWIEQGASP